MSFKRWKKEVDIQFLRYTLQLRSTLKIDGFDISPYKGLV